MQTFLSILVKKNYLFIYFTQPLFKISHIRLFILYYISLKDYTHHPLNQNFQQNPKPYSQKSNITQKFPKNLTKNPASKISKPKTEQNFQQILY